MTDVDTDNNNEVTVITARLIDLASPSEDVDKRLCSECGEWTWLSSHWKGKRIDKIVCDKCFYGSKKYNNKDFYPKVTEECLQSAIKTIKNRYNLTCSDKEIKDRLMKEYEKKIGKKIEITKN